MLLDSTITNNNHNANITTNTSPTLSLNSIPSCLTLPMSQEKEATRQPKPSANTAPTFSVNGIRIERKNIETTPIPKPKHFGRSSKWATFVTELATYKVGEYAQFHAPTQNDISTLRASVKAIAKGKYKLSTESLGKGNGITVRIIRES
jgi:hypothetical protein